MLQDALFSFPTVLVKDNDNEETLKFWVFPLLLPHTRKVSNMGQRSPYFKEFKYFLELEEISPFAQHTHEIIAVPQA